MARRIVAVAADRRFDRPATRARAADDEREVLPFERTPADERLQAPVRLRRPRDDEQTRGVAIEPVHDSRPLGLLAARRVVRDEAVDERAARVPGRRVHDEAGGLVDDEEVLVLVGNRELHLLRLDAGRRSLRRLELELLPAGKAVALDA